MAEIVSKHYPEVTPEMSLNTDHKLKILHTIPGRIKNEMFYGRSWRGVSIREFINVLDRYLRWYNERRIKMSLGAKSPMEYRQSLNCA